MLASASMALLLGSIQEPGRLRTILPNGIRLQVEATAHQERAAASLAISLAGLSQEDFAQGKVHLLEHLAAKGPGKNLDQMLEEEGVSLFVVTTRDSMLFRVSCRPRQISFALQGLLSLFQPLKVSQEEVDKEAAIMEEERLLQEDVQKMSRAAWAHVFLQEPADPMGFPEPGKVSADELSQLHARLFEAKGASVAIAGEIEAASVFGRAKNAFKDLPPGREREAPLRSAQFKPEKLVLSSVRGSARAALIEGLDSTSGLSLLGASMAGSIWLQDASPFFTPSLWRGLIYITADSSSSLAPLDRLTGLQRQGLYSLAQSSLTGYFSSLNRSPESLTQFQAGLALQNPTLTVPRLAEMAKAVTPAQIQSALEAFSDKKALVLEGAE